MMQSVLRVSGLQRNYKSDAILQEPEVRTFDTILADKHAIETEMDHQQHKSFR